MKERRLLERIAYWGEDGGQQRSHQTQVDILMQSVMAHLARLLNTRRGSVQLDPLFGVPDFTNLAGGTGVGSTRDIQDEIERMVGKYEPRIKSARVTLDQDHSDMQSLRFMLNGTIDVDDREIPLSLSTTVGASGKISLKN
ncbi:MAG TPA: type VI secretion system baseplate subunit TssE [Bordetella sp.]|uniref:type VI secretion system baseplate subunit TssE n=1 Tax=Bordetella sp. TaxID=28081 RepID=UPI002ED21B47